MKALFVKTAKMMLRKKVNVYLHDGKGNILAKRVDRNSYTFPGGGVDKGESPSTAGKREALEEVGWQTERMMAIPGHGSAKIPWGPIQKEKSLKKGRQFDGSHIYSRYAKVTKRDKSLYGIEGDAMKAKFVPIKKVIKSLERSVAAPQSEFQAYDKDKLLVLNRIRNLI